jgi:hypothetical protein
MSKSEIDRIIFPPKLGWDDVINVYGVPVNLEVNDFFANETDPTLR